jgi:hypothetical protein
VNDFPIQKEIVRVKTYFFVSYSGLAVEEKELIFGSNRNYASSTNHTKQGSSLINT